MGEACLTRMRATAEKVFTTQSTPSLASPLVPSNVDLDADTPHPPTPPPRGRGITRNDNETQSSGQNRRRSDSDKRGSGVQTIGQGSDGTDGFVRDKLTSLAKRTVERVTAHRGQEPAHSDGEGEPVPSTKTSGTPPPGRARSGKKERSRAPSPPSSYHSGSDSDEPEPTARAKSGTKPDSPVRLKSRHESLVPTVVDVDEEHNYSERSYKSSGKKARKN